MITNKGIIVKTPQELYLIEMCFSRANGSKDLGFPMNELIRDECCQCVRSYFANPLFLDQIRVLHSAVWLSVSPQALNRLRSRQTNRRLPSIRFQLKPGRGSRANLYHGFKPHGSLRGERYT